MNYLFEPDFLSRKTAATKRSLAETQPNADFVAFAAGVIYERLKADIKRYRVYGMYWWALKDVLSAQGYDMGSESDEVISSLYRGSDHAETLVAADLFYLDMSDKTLVTNNRWTIDNRRDDYVLYDADMEERNSITDSSFLVR